MVDAEGQAAGREEVVTSVIMMGLEMSVYGKAYDLHSAMGRGGSTGVGEGMLARLEEPSPGCQVH